jgi:hypothetical protein
MANPAAMHSVSRDIVISDFAKTPTTNAILASRTSSITVVTRWRTFPSQSPDMAVILDPEPTASSSAEVREFWTQNIEVTFTGTHGSTQLFFVPC